MSWVPVRVSAAVSLALYPAPGVLAGGQVPHEGGVVAVGRLGERWMEYRPQWTKIPSLASVYQPGTGRCPATPDQPGWFPSLLLSRSGRPWERITLTNVPTTRS